ncbi:hypothetical protein Vadar_004739 [Vaccinium darrowii]|uniref:Uncharacterized protein n=1 Tax=Vaccinium darrowii TaxID=229202 RepID=A0ACB7XN75_9ERIC|nr:hypothetical protein Vadar_004739 [Vaccinium darrowii]
MMAASRRMRYSSPMLYGSLLNDCSALPFMSKLCSFTSTDINCGGGGRGDRFISSASENVFCHSTTKLSDENYSHVHDYEDKQRMPNRACRTPPEPIPNRPLRGEKPIYQSEHLLSRGSHGLRRSSGGGRGYEKSTTDVDSTVQNIKSRELGGNKSVGRSTSTSSDVFRFNKLGNDNDDKDENTKQQYSRYSRPQASAFTGEKQGHDFLDKFKLGFDKGDKQLPEAGSSKQEEEEEEMKSATAGKMPPSPDADEIFKKLKETGLIPNAVAMLDGLCKDGLVQDAMRLFGLMREKGTIPEVVIYTAVVEGFCKAQKLDDAKRIFGKMKNNGIPPNAFSYTVLIQGLYKGKRLEDAVDFCVEMLDAGHSPNLATFMGLVDGFCRERGLEEAQSLIRALTQKGFYVDEKLVREYLNKNGTFSPLVWEAIFGKKSSQRLF